MRDDIVNVLLSIGIPARVKGFTYIYDAMELFDTDPYYSDGKICALYADIAKKRGTTQSRVERAIRHAFETATTKENHEMVEKYLDFVNTQNSNLLRTLYLRLKQDEKQRMATDTSCIRECALKKQIYTEMMSYLSSELEDVVKHLAESMNSSYLESGNVKCITESWNS